MDHDFKIPFTASIVRRSLKCSLSPSPPFTPVALFIISLFLAVLYCTVLYCWQVVVVVSHIQGIGCQPGKNYFEYTVANPARGLLHRKKTR